jgi:hypothetical protein
MLSYLARVEPSFTRAKKILRACHFQHVLLWTVRYQSGTENATHPVNAAQDDKNILSRVPQKKKGQIAIEPKSAPALIQPTMGSKRVRRLKSP